MSSNQHDLTGRRAGKGVFYRFPQKLDKRFSIERLKTLGSTTFARTTNLTDVEKWLSLIEKYFKTMNHPKGEK